MRESFAESEIPTGVESPVYLDARQISRGIGRHATESFIAQGTGAGGSGFDVVNVPFEPAYIKAINPAGVAPAVHESFFPGGAGTAQHVTTILAVAVNATPPVLTQIGPNDWTVEIPVGMAPDAEVLSVLIVGVREGVGGSL